MLLDQYEEEMKKKYGDSYRMDKEKVASEARAEEQRREQRLREIDDRLGRLAEDIEKNTRELLRSLVGGVGQKEGAGTSLRKFAEERLSVMNEALGELREGNKLTIFISYY